MEFIELYQITLNYIAFALVMVMVWPRRIPGVLVLGSYRSNATGKW